MYFPQKNAGFKKKKSGGIPWVYLRIFLHLADACVCQFGIEASFTTVVALAFTSLLISEDHDIAANVMICCAQFLTLTATILGIDYKFTRQ